MHARLLALAGSFALALSLPAFAHHGWGGKQMHGFEAMAILHHLDLTAEQRDTRFRFATCQRL